ncbi:MAG: HU family DNA-binding protein [Bacilli bacterium]|nr:HU family DNA-binding protein [Bacilli bacterium]
MNKKQLIEAMAKKAEMTINDAGKALDAFISTISEALKSGDDVQLTGVFSLKVGERAAREGRNPATGEKIMVPAKKVIKFKAGKQLDSAVQ